jgi:hypothetical protein
MFELVGRWDAMRQDLGNDISRNSPTTPELECSDATLPEGSADALGVPIDHLCKWSN